MGNIRFSNSKEKSIREPVTSFRILCEDCSRSPEDKLVDEIISDEVIIQGLRTGNPEAFAQLWEKYGDNVIRFLRSLGADPDDAADAAMDSVARAVEKIDQFDAQKAKGHAPFRNWLFTIARNLWRDQQRKRRNIVSLVDVVPDIYPPIATDRSPTPITEALNYALSNLPDNQRQVITLHFYDGLPLRHIARVMGAPEGTVRQWKRRALAALKLVLKDLPIFADLANQE